MAGRRPINTSAPTTLPPAPRPGRTQARLSGSHCGTVFSVAPAPQPQVGGVAWTQVPFMNGQCWGKAAPPWAGTPLPQNSELNLEFPPSWSHGVEGHGFAPRISPPPKSNLWATSQEKAARLGRVPQVTSPGPRLGDGLLPLSAANSWD